MNLVYIVFGTAIDNYMQSYFSILSALSYQKDFDKILVVTDAPEYYAKITHPALKVLNVSSSTIDEWKGTHTYVFRVKIKALQYALEFSSNTPILYLDADTFFTQEFSAIKDKLAAGKSIMHLNEGAIKASKRNTQKRIWKRIKNRTLQKVEVPKDLCMWNAGVIGLASCHSNLLNSVLSITDQLCTEEIPRRLIEQLSFSLVLSVKSELNSSRSYIAHYWGNKIEWNSFVNSMILKELLKNTSIEELIHKVTEAKNTPVPTHKIKQSFWQKITKKSN